MTSARNAPAPLCALAVAAVGNYGWGRWSDAPVTPLAPVRQPRERRGRKGRDSVSTADVTFLFENLQIDDACVRELAVRLLANAEESQVATGLHAAPCLGRLIDPRARGVWARPGGAEECRGPADVQLKDPSAGVRANSAWALGRIGDGRAVPPVTRALTDNYAVVRQAAAGALGQMDSSSAVPPCSRSCGRTPILPYGSPSRGPSDQLGSEQAVSALSQSVQGDKDDQVREMSAWALGEIGDKSARDGARARPCRAMRATRCARPPPGRWGNSTPSRRQRCSARRWRATRACGYAPQPRGRWASST